MSTRFVSTVADVVRMTREAFDHLAPCFDDAKDFIPDGTSTVYLEPRTRAVAYCVLGDDLPFGYLWERDDRTFATEAKSLLTYIIAPVVL